MMKNRKLNRIKNFDYSSTGYYFVTMCVKNREMLFGELQNNDMVLSKYGEIVKQDWLDLPKHHPNLTLDVWIIMPDHIHGIIIINNEPTLVGTGLPVITEPKNDQSECCNMIGKPVLFLTPEPKNDQWANGNTAEKPVLSNSLDRTRTGLSATMTIPNGNAKLPSHTQNLSLQRENKPVLSNYHTRTGLSAIMPCPNNRSILSVADDKPVPTMLKLKNLSEIIRGFKTFSSRKINKQQPFQWQRSFHDHIIRNDDDLARIRNYITNNPQKHFNKQIESQWE